MKLLSCICPARVASGAHLCASVGGAFAYAAWLHGAGVNRSGGRGTRETRGPEGTGPYVCVGVEDRTEIFCPPPPVDHTHTRTKPPRTPPLRKALSSIYLYTTNVFMACLPLGCRVTAERPPSAPPTTPPPIPARNSIIADKISCVGRVTAGLIYTRPSPKYTSGGWVPNLNAAELRGWTGERGPGLACKLNVHVLLFLQRER